MAISVNMLRFIDLTERQPRLKNGQPAHQTTGVVSPNWIQRETSPVAQACRPSAGIMCAIARRNTGRVSTAPIQKRRVMSSSSVFSSSSPASAFAFIGSNAIPHFGHSPG